MDRTIGVVVSSRIVAGLIEDHKLVAAVALRREDGKSIRQIASELRLSTNTVLKVLMAA